MVLSYYSHIIRPYMCTRPCFPKFSPSLWNLELSTTKVLLDLPGSTARIFDLPVLASDLNRQAGIKSSAKRVKMNCFCCFDPYVCWDSPKGGENGRLYKPYLNEQEIWDNERRRSILLLYCQWIIICINTYIDNIIRIWYGLRPHNMILI
jgi:hypothetical protein